jgi:hypothetical protein
MPPRKTNPTSVGSEGGAREREGRVIASHSHSHDMDSNGLRHTMPHRGQQYRYDTSTGSPHREQPVQMTMNSDMQSRRGEGAKTKMKTNMKKGKGIVAATQNFRGGLQDEEKVEEVMAQMRR